MKWYKFSITRKELNIDKKTEWMKSYDSVFKENKLGIYTSLNDNDPRIFYVSSKSMAHLLHEFQKYQVSVVECQKPYLSNVEIFYGDKNLTELQEHYI